MMFSVKGFFSKCDQIRSFLQIWSHLLEKYLMENFIFCAEQEFSLELKIGLFIVRKYCKPWGLYLR